MRYALIALLLMALTITARADDAGMMMMGVGGNSGAAQTNFFLIDGSGNKFLIDGSNNKFLIR